MPRDPSTHHPTDFAGPPPLSLVRWDINYTILLVACLGATIPDHRLSLPTATHRARHAVEARLGLTSTVRSADRLSPQAPNASSSAANGSGNAPKKAATTCATSCIGRDTVAIRQRMLHKAWLYTWLMRIRKSKIFLLCWQQSAHDFRSPCQGDCKIKYATLGFSLCYKSLRAECRHVHAFCISFERRHDIIMLCVGPAHHV